MKLSTRLVFRKMAANKGQIIGMGILIFVASLFFTTMMTFTYIFEEGTEDYFKRTNYAQTMLYGSFTEDNINTLETLDNIDQIEGRYVQDFKQKEKIFRLISVTSTLNKVELIEGKLPANKGEGAIISQYARENNVKIGAKLTVNDQKLTVVGIINSPEYVYYIQNPRTLSADKTKFAVVFVHKSYFDGYNELLVNGAPVAKDLKPYISFTQLTKQKDQMNYQMYEGELEEFGTFAFIFPTVFWLISFSIIFILLRRTILKEHKQIGILKAMGHSTGSLLKIYLLQFGIMGSVASFLGCLSSIAVLQWLTSVIKIMIEVPDLTFKFYSDIWLFSILLSTASCLIAGLLAITTEINQLPSMLLKARIPRGGKRLILERMTFIWRRLSFNTRYSLKSTLRNKGRFFVMVIGIAASTALLILSFGFNDSLKATSQGYFNDFANYDLVIESDVMPLELDELPYSRLIQQADRALQLAVTVDDEEFPLLVVKPAIQALALKGDQLKKGIIIPEYYAKKWKVVIGDKVKIDGSWAKISGTVPLGMGLSIFTSYEYAKKLKPDLPEVFNTTYLQSSKKRELARQLERDDLVFSMAADDITAFNAMMESLQVLIFMLLFLGTLLGITVISSINIMNLTIREFEYMFMNIMGYSKGKILLAILKETIMQVIIALPLGFLGGVLFLHAIKSEFSQTSFALYPTVYLKSFLITGIIIVVMCATKLTTANRFINKLDIVEGLKVQDD